MKIMTQKSVFEPIVRNIQNNDLYSWDGEKFTNLRTLKSGVVDDETARRVFKMNVDATNMINDFPIVKDMIHIFNLKLEKNERQ
jgi:hypothetical protein